MVKNDKQLDKVFYRYYLDEDCNPFATVEIEDLGAPAEFSDKHIIRLYLNDSDYVDLLVENNTERLRADYHFWEDATSNQLVLFFDVARKKPFIDGASHLLGGSLRVLWDAPSEHDGPETQHSLHVYADPESGQDKCWIYAMSYVSVGVTYKELLDTCVRLRELCENQIASVL